MADPVEFVVKQLPYDLSSHGGQVTDSGERSQTRPGAGIVERPLPKFRRDLQGQGVYAEYAAAGCSGTAPAAPPKVA